jgi:hypothetical protein
MRKEVPSSDFENPAECISSENGSLAMRSLLLQGWEKFAEMNFKID